jgi:antitoxin (DNA-binding transcriptional repressor) of toxin-antitoxin stability system
MKVRHPKDRRGRETISCTLVTHHAKMSAESAMVLTVPTQEAAAKLVDLAHDLGPGDEIVLTDGGRRLARILPEIPHQEVRRPGACRGMLEVVDEGDEAVLEHFREYVP